MATAAGFESEAGLGDIGFDIGTPLNDAGEGIGPEPGSIADATSTQLKIMMNRRLRHANRLGPLAVFCALCLVSIAAVGCAKDGPVTYTFDFSRSASGWRAGFADYPPADEPGYELTADYRALPSPLDTSKRALYIAGTNHSDDLFMYYKGQLSAGRPATYRVWFDLEIATSAPRGCGGVGGSPGESVSVKAGAAPVEPNAVLDGLGYLRLNVDKGQQANGGNAALVLGDVANTRECGAPIQWERKQLSGGPLLVTTDGAGGLWLFVGTDSGFEARTAVYYSRLVVRLEQSAGGQGLGITAPTQ